MLCYGEADRKEKKLNGQELPSSCHEQNDFTASLSENIPV